VLEGLKKTVLISLKIFAATLLFVTVAQPLFFTGPFLELRGKDSPLFFFSSQLVCAFNFPFADPAPA